MKRILLLSSAALSLGVCFTGCLILGNRVDANRSVGSELTDLKKARDGGALSESEYQKAKAQVLSPERLRNADAKTPANPAR